MPFVEPDPSSSDFTDGVLWGMFLGTFDQDDHAADFWRVSVLGAVVDQIDKTPDAPMWELRSCITEAWDSAQASSGA
jgi:hypothetical protein